MTYADKLLAKLEASHEWRKNDSMRLGKWNEISTTSRTCKVCELEIQHTAYYEKPDEYKFMLAGAQISLRQAVALERCVEQEVQTQMGRHG